MRQCVEEWGGGWGGGGRESQKHPGGTDSLASAGCQSALATPRPGAASVSTHFHTWTNSSTGQEKQPTHPPIHPSLHLSLSTFYFSTIWGTISCLLTPSPSFPSFLILLFATAPVLSWLCTYIPFVLHRSLETLFAMLCMYVIWPLYT